MFMKNCKILLSCFLICDTGWHSIRKLLSPQNGNTASNLQEREYQIMNTNNLLSLNIIRRIPILIQTSGILPRTPILDTSSRNQNYPKFMCIYIQFYLINKSLDNRDRPQTITRCQLIMKWLCPVIKTTYH